MGTTINAQTAIASVTGTTEFPSYDLGQSNQGRKVTGEQIKDYVVAFVTPTSLGLVIGSDVQAYSAELDAIAGVSVGADEYIYGLGGGSLTTGSITGFGRSFVAQVDDAGGRTALGLEIGVDVQAYSGWLDSMAAVEPSTDEILICDGFESFTSAATGTKGLEILTANDAASARDAMSLGTLAVQDTINNDDWSGSELIVSNGGTGATNEADARNNLGLSTVSQAEAEAGTVTTTRAWTPERVAQAIAAQGTTVLDQDFMDDDSDTAAPSQQSTKSFVETHSLYDINEYDLGYRDSLGRYWVSVFNSGGDVKRFAYCGDGIVVATHDGTNILRSTDSGDTWADVAHGLGVNPTALCYVGNGTLLAIEGTDCYVSTDKGLTWGSAIATGLTGTTQFITCIGNGDAIICDSSNNIRKTTNSGSTWSTVTSPFDTACSDFAKGPGDLVFAIGQDSNTATCAISTDNGSTFTLSGSLARTNFAGERILYLGNGRLVCSEHRTGGSNGARTAYSFDNGATWTYGWNVGLNTNHRVTGLATDGNGVLVAVDNWQSYVGVSHDYGDDWATLGPLTSSNTNGATDACYVGNGKFLVAVNRSGGMRIMKSSV